MLDESASFHGRLARLAQMAFHEAVSDAGREKDALVPAGRLHHDI